MSGWEQREQDQQMLNQWERVWLDPDWDRVLGYRRYPGECANCDEDE